MIKKNNVSRGLEAQRSKASLKMGGGGQEWPAGQEHKENTQVVVTQGGNLASSHQVWRPA